MATKGFGIVLAVVSCLSTVTPVVADDTTNGCDLVQISAIGTRQGIGVNDRFVGNGVMTIPASGNRIPIEFTGVVLGITDVQSGKIIRITSHDFKGTDDPNINFTTFDEFTTVLLGGDPQCTEGTCGVVVRMKLERGAGNYNCGDIVTGFDASLQSFASTLQGDTLQLNAVGKLCTCSLSENQ